jgi:hypothetical protein
VEHKVPAVNGEDSFSYEAHSASPDEVSATREHVERQARLGKELQQLTQLMCHKQQLAQQLQQEQDSGDMHALREKYEVPYHAIMGSTYLVTMDYSVLLRTFERLISAFSLK